MKKRRSVRGEGSAADKRWDKAHPNAKEGSKTEEAFDRRMAKGRRAPSRKK